MTPKHFPQITIFTDGGSRGNPGPAGIGVHAQADQSLLFQLSEYIGETTNNVAEYLALIKAFEYLIANQFQADQFTFILDSELIVKQINGQYKIKTPHIKEHYQQLQSLLSSLKSSSPTANFTFTHVTRDKNKIADSLVNQALDQRLS